jgi:nucleotide-binding universal stress UspA family protein
MDTAIPTVVVGYDGSSQSMITVDAAAAEAASRGARLSLLSAHPSPGYDTGPRISLTAALRRTCLTWPGLAVTARNITAEPASALIEASRTAALVVIGRRRPDRALRPDSVAAQVVSQSQCPTLVVPAGAPMPAGAPVLLGLGLAPNDEPVIGFAFAEAALRRVPLVVVHVWSDIPAGALGTISPLAYDLYEAQALADEALAEMLAGWADKYPDVTVDRMPLYDVNPARTLLDASTLADLVVVGSRCGGHNGNRRSSQRLGVVTRTLIAHASRPVAVIHPTQ